PTGCSRCIPRVSPVCCDLCHPEFFDKYQVTPSTITGGTVLKKLNIKPFDMDTTHIGLKKALHAWCHDQAVLKYTQSIVRIYGGKLVLPDEIVDHLISCTHAHKLDTVLHLLKEMDLSADWVNELGESVLAVIH
ncbi:hypothetical protein CPB84DRAFT_1624472, partial [Gymnopilus junonius]